MVDNSKLNPQKGPLSFEEWQRQNGASLTGLTEDQILEKYKIYEQSFKGAQLPGAQTTPQFEDNTDKTQTTELQKEQPTNNIDLMGATSTLAQFGIATGNSDLTKAGLLGNSAVKMIQQLKATKGLKGVNKTAGIVSTAGGMADTVDQMFFGNQAAKNSTLTNGLNMGYDLASSAIMTMGPQGAMIGGAMKIGGLLSDGLTAMGIGTDQMTTTDKILDSKFLKLTPIGLVNSIGASTSDRFSVDNSVREQIGGSYGGAYAFMDDAASRAGKKYGFFSNGSRKAANRDIAKSKVIQGKIGNINKDARDRQSIVNNSSDLLSTNYMFNLNGGIDQRYLRANKEGGKIERIKKINLSFRKGGQINNVINLETKSVEWEPIIIQKQGGTINWKYEQEQIVAQKQEEAIDDWEPIIIYKNGGKSNNSEEKPLSNQQNVIPEGALHARLHHMDNADELTKKGIPVIDNKGEQQAEIELNEIIFNLDVTKKLEELYKDGSDKAAIEAGKLLVQEILFNTNDRTGIIKTLKQGGVINGDTE